MSDFLGRLVERSMGMAETVRPRPISLFEMPAPLPETPLEQADEAAAPQPLPRPAPPPTFDRTLPPAPAPAQRAGPVPVAAPQPLSVPAPPPPPATAPARGSTDSAPVHTPPRLRREPPGTHGDSGESAPPRAPEPAPTPRSAPVVVRRAQQEPARPVPPSPPTPIIGPNLVRETRVEQTTVLERVIQREQRDATLFRPTITARPEPQRPEALRPAPEPASPSPLPTLPSGMERWREPVESASPPAAPAVHVTIGRLEIRAAPKRSETPRRTPAQVPVMSLDDYLRQRASGNKP